MQKVKHPNLQYKHILRVPVTTMDRLIEIYGVSDFCKIDVEGFEYNVLRGLTQTIPVLSFEYTRERIRPALDYIDRLTMLGQYEYNYSSEETMALGGSEWLRAEDMPGFVRDVIVHRGGSFGDIYARLV